jgi:hypothetical protein
LAMLALSAFGEERLDGEEWLDGEAGVLLCVVPLGADAAGCVVHVELVLGAAFCLGLVQWK